MVLEWRGEKMDLREDRAGGASGGLLRSCWDVKCGRATKMDNGLSDKKERNSDLYFKPTS